MKRALFIFSWLLLVAGLVWAAQGAGIFPYPAESFMIGSRPWIGYGLGTALLGVALMIVSRKMR